MTREEIFCKSLAKHTWHSLKEFILSCMPEHAAEQTREWVLLLTRLRLALKMKSLEWILFISLLTRTLKWKA